MRDDNVLVALCCPARVCNKKYGGSELALHKATQLTCSMALKVNECDGFIFEHIDPPLKRSKFWRKWDLVSGVQWDRSCDEVLRYKFR